jgi:hypothetical protein
MVNQLVSEARNIDADNPREKIGGNNPPRVHELLITEMLETYRLELEKAEPIAVRANSAPEKIESDDDLKAWTGIYLDADKLFKSIDASRLNEKRPLEAALKTVFGPTLERLERITKHARKISDDYNRAKLKKEREEREAQEKAAREAAEKSKQEAAIAAEFGDTDAVVEHAKAVASNEAEAARILADAPKVADVARVRADDGAGMSTAKTEWKFEIDFAAIDLNALRLLIDQKAITAAVGKIVKVQKGSTKITGVRVFEDVATQFRR